MILQQSSRNTFTPFQKQEISSLMNALKKCRSSGDVDKGRKIHSDAIRLGYASNLYIANTLIDMYAKCGSLAEARKVFEKLRRREVVSWNILLMGYVQNGQSQVSLDLFSAMQSENCLPNGRTFVAVLKACCELAGNEEPDVRLSVRVKSLEKGMAIHRLAVDLGCELELFVASSLVDMYCKCGELQSARRVFDRMELRGVVSWTALMLGYVEKEQPEVAVELFCCMLSEGCVADARAFVAVLKACSFLAVKEETTDSVIGCVKLVSLERAMSLHSQASAGGNCGDIFVRNTLIDLYANCYSMQDARRVFDGTRSPDTVTWNVLLLGYIQNRDSQSALDMFWWMIWRETERPNYLTFVAALKACGNLTDLRNGRAVHEEICRRGLEKDRVVAATLVDFYGRCGCMREAELVSESTSDPDVVVWSALAAGYCRQGETRRVFEVYRGMKEQGLEPNGIMFLSILNACSHAGLVGQGEEWFRVMQSEYRVNADIEHYHCMIDLLGRANRVDDAVTLLKRMPFRANPVSWTSVFWVLAGNS